VDSALLAYLAHTELGTDALSVTAVSASLARAELDEIRKFCTQHGIDHLELETHEFDDPLYIQNGTDRCYVCKSHLMRALAPIARSRNATVVLGTNVDDLGDFRPGIKAAREGGAEAPYLDCGIDKATVRRLAFELGLKELAAKPSAPCLASRVPYGTEVTLRKVGQIEHFEAYLKKLGIRACRVRHHGDVARIEVPFEYFGVIIEHREEISHLAERLGFAYSTLDLGGLRSGSLNRIIGRRNGEVQGQVVV
jgi:uncharacterized protein